MKTILVVLLSLCVGMASQAQRTIFVNAGTSVQDNQQSYSAEVGLSGRTARYAVGLSTSEQSVGHNYEQVFAKGYWKVTHGNEVNVFATGGASMTLDRYHSLSVEPGAALMWSVTKHFAPQVSIGFPIQQNSVLRERPLGIVGGISLNYFFD